MNVLNTGDVVRFAVPVETGDDRLRFTVVEDRGDRVLVVPHGFDDWQVKPQAVYAAADLIRVDGTR